VTRTDQAQSTDPVPSLYPTCHMYTGSIKARQLSITKLETCLNIIITFLVLFDNMWQII